MAKEKRADGLLYSILQNTLQRYNTPHSIWHLLAFSIAKMGENMRLTNGYSVFYNHWKIFQNFPATEQKSPLQSSVKQLENQAGLPLTSRDARRVRPHQTAYSIGKRVNEGRRASVPAKWNAIRKIKRPQSPPRITDYRLQLFWNSHAPLSVRHKKNFIIIITYFLYYFSSLWLIKINKL